jgi:hypothetical protein
MKHTLLINLLIFLFSCGNKPNKVVENLETEVIAIHDEVMPKTNDIYHLKKTLRSKLAETQDSTAILNLIHQLEAADEVMMVWMDQYKHADMTKDTTYNMAYLREQREKIIQVKDEMLSAIQKTKDFLQNN